MSRMVLNGNLWLSLRPERALGDGGYPPCNIELVPASETGAEALRITLAVAGFARGDLEVSIEDGALVVSGKREDEGKDYLHRGIAARRFRRSFALKRGVEVRKAELHNGLLTIELERPEKERKVVKVGISTTT